MDRQDTVKNDDVYLGSMYSLIQYDYEVIYCKLLSVDFGRCNRLMVGVVP